MPSELSLLCQISSELDEECDCTLARYVPASLHCLIAQADLQKKAANSKLVRVYTAAYGRSAPAAGLRQVQHQHAQHIDYFVQLVA